MIARLDESFQHIHRFSAVASHGLRTPLTVLRGELEAATQHPKITSELRETLGGALADSRYEMAGEVYQSWPQTARFLQQND